MLWPHCVTRLQSILESRPRRLMSLVLLVVCLLAHLKTTSPFILYEFFCMCLTVDVARSSCSILWMTSRFSRNRAYGAESTTMLAYVWLSSPDGKTGREVRCQRLPCCDSDWKKVCVVCWVLIASEISSLLKLYENVIVLFIWCHCVLPVESQGKRSSMTGSRSRKMLIGFYQVLVELPPPVLCHCCLESKCWPVCKKYLTCTIYSQRF